MKNKQTDEEVRASGCKRIEDDIQNGDIIIPRHENEIKEWNELKNQEWNLKNPQDKI